MRAVAVHGSIRVGVWICSTDDVPQKELPEGRSRDEVVWLSKRARDLLRVDGALIEVAAEAPQSLRVLPALVDRLPADNEAEVSADDAKRLGRWALAWHDGFTMPLRLRVKPNEQGMIRMSRLTRVLGRLTDEHPRVRLSRLQPEHLQWRDRFVGRTAMRLFSFFLELLLRPLFHAPAVAMSTVEAKLGDDTNRVIRMAPQMFNLIGVRPGDDILVEWAGRRVIAVAHESFDAKEHGHAHVPTVDTWGANSSVPDEARHLVIGIGAQLRGELRIPRRTVVIVRRRVSTIFARRVNELTLPIGGLLLAAVAIKGFPVIWVFAGAVIVTILAMLPARYRVPPRGRWP
ncbi:MAG TPA: hypothetical protein VF219_22860 [Vicinamibacterales bacterium]